MSALGAEGPPLALCNLLGGGHGRTGCGSRLVCRVAARAALLASSAPPLLEVEVPEAGFDSIKFGFQVAEFAVLLLLVRSQGHKC